MDYLGLGIRLGLRDEMTDRLRPVISELDRLERKAMQATAALNNMNGLSGFSNMHQRRFAEFNRGLQDTDTQLVHISRRLIQAAGSADRFVNATNRLQGINNFQRMYGEITRVQRQIGQMSGVMSKMQQTMMDKRAFNMLNYQVKDLHEKIALTRRGIEQMNRSPDSARFREQITLARVSLAAYERELKQVNTQQKLASQFGMRVINTSTGDAYIRPADSLRAAAANRLLGASMRDMGVASGIAYRSVKRTSDLLVGFGYTTMEAKRKLTQLAGQLTGFGMIMSQFVTLPLIIAAGALAKFASAFESAQNVFHARTLVSQEQMDQLHGFKDLIEDIKIGTGQSYEVTSTTLAASQNILGAGASKSKVADTAENALFMNKIWGVDSTKAIREVTKLTKDLGVSSTQAWDMYNMGAAEANKTGKTDILDLVKSNSGYYKKQTGKGGAMDGSMDQAIENYTAGPMEQARQGMMRLGSIVQEMWQSVEGGLGKFFGFLNRGTQAIVEFTRTHPMLTKIATVFAGIGLSLLAVAGPIALVTGFMVRYKGVLQGINASIFGLSKGGIALLAPQAKMAKDRMDGLIVSIARAPQTLLSILPMLYTAIRSIPNIIARIIKINPIFATLTLGIVAYTKNWWGLRDTVNNAVDIMQEKWGKLVEAYKKSDLPAMFERFGANAKAFGEGFADGLGIAVDMGVYLVEEVLKPIKWFAEEADETMTKLANGVSKIFGGDGDFKAGLEKWKDLGKLVGTVVGGLFALKGIFALTKFLISPFVSMNNSVKTVGATIDRLIARMGVLAAATKSSIITKATGAAGAVTGAAGATRRYIFGNNTGSSVTSTPSIFRRATSAAMMPITYPLALMQRGLSGMGIGRNIFMGDRLAQARQAGLGVRGNAQAISMLRGINPGVTARGSLGGTGVYGSSRGVVGRALFGQNYSTYTPVRDQNGRITGYQQNQVARTGGLLRRSNTQDLGNRPNLAARMYSGTGALMTAGMGALGGLAGAGMAGARARLSGSMLGRAYRGVGRGFDRAVSSRPARALAGAGRWAGNRLTSAGVRNPFAGALNPAAGAGRMGAVRNFAGRTLGGMGTMAAGAAGMMGRGAVRTVGGAARGVGTVARGAARGVGAVGRGIGAVGGGLLRAAPWLMLAGFGGKMAYDKLGVGADGKKSVGNVSGNLDKITEGIGKGGTGSIKQFWDKFKKYGGDIMKSVVKLITASLKALAPLIPGMMKDAWNGIKKLAGAAWKWIKTDGLAMAKATGKGLMTVLGAAWEWIKTDGMALLGQFWDWLKGTAAPAAASALMKLLGKAWNWIKTSGVEYLGQFVTWFIGTAIPTMVDWAMSALGALWDWVKDDGIAMLWGLVVDFGSIALELGSAIWNGITSALSGLGEWILGLIPTGGEIMSWVKGKIGMGGDDGGKKHARGGYMTSPHWGVVGEDGPEMIIPMSNKMSGITHNLFNQTAKMLGYSVEKTDKVKMSTNTGIKGNESSSPEVSIKQFINGAGKLPETTPKRNVSQSSGKPQSQDNSVKIEKIEIKFDGRIPENTVSKAKEMTSEFMRQLKRRLQEERARTGNDKLTLDDLLLDY